jgi:hypothetical protein
MKKFVAKSRTLAALHEVRLPTLLSSESRAPAAAEITEANV